MLKKQYKKLPLLILLSLPFLIITTNTHTNAIQQKTVENLVPQQVSFAGTILVKVDGILGILDAESINDCFSTCQKIMHLINGIKDANGNYVGIFEYEGKRYTLKDIVVLELNLIKTNVSKDHPEYIKYLTMLSLIKEIFQKEAGPLLEKTKKPAVREMNKSFINIWITNANRSNSILKDFGTIDELAALERANAKEFFLFLNDLKCFLKDLMRNAPRACELYKKECLKPEDYGTFDHFINS